MSWAMVGAAAVSAGTSASEGKKNRKAAEQGQQLSDPFGPYRAQYAQQLQTLMSNPNSIQGMPVYKAMQQAASRTMQAQGYTGSGNALAAAANAGGQAYQSQFNDLALLSGAGIQPGSSGTSMAGQVMGANQAEGSQLSSILGSLMGSGGGGKNSAANNQVGGK